MTLIAFTCSSSSAEFITDTASYTPRVTALGTCTKHQTLNHLDAAVLTQGNSTFGNLAKSALLQVSAQVASFDELTDEAAHHLTKMWNLAREDHRGEPSDSVVYLIGYSYRASAFVAFGYASDNTFAPFEATGTTVLPMPWARKPTDLELARFRRHYADRNDLDDLCATWTARPPMSPPKGADGWRWLAREVRASRALQHFAHVIVAGRVIHTRLERGKVTTETIHEFNDTGEEFAQLVAWTQHPIAQAAACHCQSGKRFIDCHLREELDLPCGCGGDVTFGDCCADLPTVGAADRKVS